MHTIPQLQWDQQKSIGPVGSCSCDVPLPEGGWRCLTMALVQGLVAVLPIVPPGNKVALGEMVRRALSASSTPRVVFGGGDARRKLARRASRWTRAAWGLLLASLAAWLLLQPGARCLSSSLAPPKTGKIAT